MAAAASDGDGIRLLTRLLGAVDFDSARWWYKQERMAGQMYVLGWPRRTYKLRLVGKRG